MLRETVCLNAPLRFKVSQNLTRNPLGLILLPTLQRKRSSENGADSTQGETHRLYRPVSALPIHAIDNAQALPPFHDDDLESVVEHVHVQPAVLFSKYSHLQ